MPGELTEITEIVTALGMLADDLETALARKPAELYNVSDESWNRLVVSRSDDRYAASYRTAFTNGQAFFYATDGLRRRPPLRVEWKGPHRPPGDDVIPADLRIDHVFLVSCKYLSKVLLNPGPRRLFERLLIGEGRSDSNWFEECGPAEFQRFYEASLIECRLSGLPRSVRELSRSDQAVLKNALADRKLPASLHPSWTELCEAVATESARRWSAAVSSKAAALRLLWRMLRISGATYFVLGTDKTSHLRLRVDSAWDWVQAYELKDLWINARQAGQPEVVWRADVRDRLSGGSVPVSGHVEIRWSHGRFFGFPEAKIYLDTPQFDVPGYRALV